MDFNSFLEKIGMLVGLGWKAELLDLCCDYFPEKHPKKHNHLKLRFLPPRADGHNIQNWLSPIQAVCLELLHNKDADPKFLNYTDPNVSLNGIYMAGDFVDWGRNGYGHYVDARLRLLRVCKIEAEYVLFRAPQPRSFVRWQK
jgi:hypothetical protein